MSCKKKENKPFFYILHVKAYTAPHLALHNFLYRAIHIFNTSEKEYKKDKMWAGRGGGRNDIYQKHTYIHPAKHIPHQDGS